jgi:hypothetical protein
MYVKHITGIVTVLLIVVALAATVDTPSRSAGASDPAVDYPELKITANGNKFEMSSEVVMGRYLVTVDNQGEEGVDAQIIQVPEGRTVEEVAQAFADPNENAAWLYDATWAGGPTVLASKQGQTIVDLAATATRHRR